VVLLLLLLGLDDVGFGGAAIEFLLTVVAGAEFSVALMPGGFGDLAGEGATIVATGAVVEAGIVVFLIVLLVAALGSNTVLLLFVLDEGVGVGANDTGFLFGAETWRFLGGGSSSSVWPSWLSFAGCPRNG